MAAAKKNTPARGAKGVTVARDAWLANALADASWAEADEALAEALIEFAELKRALHKEPETLGMASQALARAARRRGLVLFGDVGATVAFDPAVHELNGSSVVGARVRITREGVMRGRDVLIGAVVRPARKVAKRAPR
jgi:hypothetical protein